MSLFEKTTSFFATLCLWIENTIFLQAVCTLVSVPILYGWQMPYSKFSALGNIIFAPFMASFIFLSAIIFLFSLCGFFPKFLLQSFEKFVSAWTVLLEQGSRSWLAIPGKIVLGIWLLGAVGSCVFLYKNVAAKNVRLFLISWLFVFSGFIFLQNYFVLSVEKTVVFSKGKSSLEFIKTHNGLTLIDRGVFGRCQAVENLILYSLRSFLLKEFGDLNIETLKLTRFSSRTLKAAFFCTKFFVVKNVELPKKWQDSNFYLQNQSLAESLLIQIKNNIFQLKINS